MNGLEESGVRTSVQTSNLKKAIFPSKGAKNRKARKEENDEL